MRRTSGDSDLPPRTVADPQAMGWGHRADAGRPSVSSSRPASTPWAVPLGKLVAPCLGPVVARQGFAAADVVLMWGEIVGVRLAGVCEPIRMQWPPRSRARGRDAPAPTATLVVRVEGAFALELQHLTAVVIERINAHLGWRCVGKLALRQAPVRRATPPRLRVGAAPDVVARARSITAAIDDEPLREAMTRLGEAVLGRRSREA